jgi:23S rRNA pseudouridine1911/1915/1917 synthase
VARRKGALARPPASSSSRGRGARPAHREEASLPTLAARVRALTGGGSWSAAKALCAAGRVVVDGTVEKDPASRPSQSALIEIAAAVAFATPSLLVYHDADLAVVRKPAGVLSVPYHRADRDTLLALTRVALGRVDRRTRATVRAVQRLDRESSGLVVFARSVVAQRALQAQFAAHAVRRSYQAIAHGTVTSATHETLLVRDRGDGLRGSWREARGGPPADARWATTHVVAEETWGESTLVTCRLETGRQHQIRIHLAEDGHPLLGETVYGREFAGPWLEAPRLLLHAGVLGFEHPRTGRAMRFEEAVPDDFQAVVTALRKRARRRT